MKLEVRPETEQDQPAVHEALVDAFGQPDEARLVDALRASAAFIPELSLVADAGRSVVGHVLFTRLHVRGAERKPGLALAPMGVKKAFQKLGIGGQLVRAGLRSARQKSEPFVVVLGHPDYYPRFGFKRASGWGISVGFQVPDEALMAIELRKGGLDGVSGLIEWAPEFGLAG